MTVTLSRFLAFAFLFFLLPLQQYCSAHSRCKRPLERLCATATIIYACCNVHWDHSSLSKSWRWFPFSPSLQVITAPQLTHLLMPFAQSVNLIISSLHISYHVPVSHLFIPQAAAAVTAFPLPAVKGHTKESQQLPKVKNFIIHPPMNGCFFSVILQKVCLQPKPSVIFYVLFKRCSDCTYCCPVPSQPIGPPMSVLFTQISSTSQGSWVNIFPSTCHPRFLNAVATGWTWDLVHAQRMLLLSFDPEATIKITMYGQSSFCSYA